LSVADIVNGGAGTDVMNVTITGGNAGTTFAPAAISGIETLNIRNVSGLTNSLDASTIAGLTSVNADRATSTVTVTNLAAGASAAVIGNGTVVNGAFNAGYAAAVTAATLNFTGGTVSDAAGASDVGVTGAALTSVVINSTGAANKIDDVSVANTVKSVTIDAATDLSIGVVAGGTGLSGFAAGTAITVKGAAALVDMSGDAVAANVVTIDASTFTGGVKVGALNAGITSFKGGAGADQVTTAALTTTTAGVIDGGAGTADLLNVAAGTDVDTAAEAALYTNFEVLRNSGTTDLDVSLVSGITSIQLSNAGAGATKMTAAQAAAITNRADNATNTFSLTTATGTSDVMSVTLQNSTATASADLTGATVDGFETLNVVSSSGTSADINALGFASAANLTTLTISGAKPISVTTTNIVKAAAINASAVTYAGSTATDFALTITGNLVKGSSVTGSAAADSLTTTAAITGTSGDFVTYDAGSGNDALSSTVAAINNTSGANGSVKIEGGAGTDTLTLTDAGGLTLVDANVQFVTGVEKITYAVANQAISITSGGFFDTNFKTAGVTLTLGDAMNAQVNTVDLTSFSGAATVALTATAATTQAQTITTGSGADTVTLLAAGTTSAAHVISTGAGNDTINVTVAGATVTTGTVTINGGAGKDTITITGETGANADAAVNQIVKVQEGHSTVADFDVITGAVLSVAGAKEVFRLDFDGAAAANANVTASGVTGYTSAELTYTVTNGLLAFAGTSAAALTAAQKATVAQTVITGANSAVAFVDGTDSYVFHNGASTDSLVKLVGVTLLGIDAPAVGFIDIA
jgi:hypothetical protein